MRELYFVRHGETELNVQHRVQGSRDAPLTNRGIQQAEQVGRILAEVSFDRIYSGTLSRQIQTASYIMQENRTGCCPIVCRDPRLNELDYGSLEGKHLDDLEAQFLAVYEGRYETFAQMLVGEGARATQNVTGRFDSTGLCETGEHGAKRIADFFLEIIDNKAEYILIVTSGGMLSLMVEILNEQGLLRGAVPKQKTCIFPNCSILKIRPAAEVYYAEVIIP